MSSQENRYAKISAAAAVVALVLGYLAWQYPKQARPNPAGPPDEAPEIQHGPDFSTGPSGGRGGTPTPSPPASGDGRHLGDGEKGTEDDPGGSPGSCGVPEIATLRPGAPTKVAAGLAILSVKPAREGSESYLTLGIASDRGTVAEAVPGAPVGYRFATSRGIYFINVIDIDLTAGSMTVQVGCQAKENAP